MHQSCVIVSVNIYRAYVSAKSGSFLQWELYAMVVGVEALLPTSWLLPRPE